MIAAPSAVVQRPSAAPEIRTILHITAPAGTGGLERVVLSLASGQRRLGHAVHVAGVLTGAAAGSSNHWLLTRLARSGVTTHEIRVGRRGYRSERAQVAALCGRLRPDIVHTHGYRSDVVDAGVARRLGFPTVTTVHGFTGGGLKNRAYEGLQRRAFRTFTRVVAVSRPLAEGLMAAGVPSDRLRIVQNAWGGEEPVERSEARARLGLEDGIPHVGWVGRLSREKGLDVLIDALPLLGEASFTLSIVGDGPDRRALTERTRRLGVDRWVRWHGVVADAGSLLRAFDLLVLSSRTEGTPIVLLEAMAAGTPVVTTAVGGVPHVLSPLEAILVPAEDPRALATGIRMALADPVASRRHAERARQRVTAEFSIAPWLAAYDSVYDEARTHLLTECPT